jgi:hypothetical protein
LPSGWIRKDIGTSGTATISNGILTMDNINGEDVWQNKYGATHVYKNSIVSGDFVAVAKVTGQRNTNSWAMAGITIQNYVQAKNYNGMALMVVTPGSGYAFQWQSNPDNIAPDINLNGGTVNLPTYIKIVRNGSYVSGWNSSDGKNWMQGPLETPFAIEDFQYVTLMECPVSTSQTGEANFSMFYVYHYASPEPTGTVGNEETRTNESWFPIKEVGLADQPDILSVDKIANLNANCDLLLNFGMNTYRLRIYNSTSLLLYCGTESLSPAKITESRYVKIGNDFGNITLEMW